MDRELAVVLTAVVGGLIALQAPINSMLGRSVGTFQAAFFSFLLGTVVLAAIAAVSKGSFGALAGVRDVAWVYLLGGILGAIYVTCVLVTVRTLGAGGVTAATIGGQLAMSLVVDRFGWLGVERQDITSGNLAGIVLLAAGVFLIVRD